MKEQIEKIITEYQNAITEYFEMEVPMENDAENMDNFLENLKAEILELIK
jgi:precorrin-2 methylase